MDTALVFFVYGLAFFSLGLAMRFESTRSPSLAHPRALFALAFFGLVHGAHEWVEMFIDHPEWVALPFAPAIESLRPILLIISFISLLMFGVWVLLPGNIERKTDFRTAILAGIVLLATLFYLGWAAGGASAPLRYLDVSARYLLAVPGAAVAAIGLYSRSQAYKGEDNRRLRWMLIGAAGGFLIYSFSQIVVPPLGIFPANLLNTTAFRTALGFPIQVVRAGAAVLIAVCMIVVVNQLEYRRQAQFLAAERERIDTLEQLQQGLIERESMRQELLRHIVIAQEDERARVARELHDETSQILTAFTFHLAVLQQSLPKQAKVREQLEYLQRLSRQMSQSVYRLVRDLRPAQLDDLGLVAALQYLVDEQDKLTGLTVDLRIQGEKRRLDPLVETVLFRVAQEALTNISRHAGVGGAEMNLLFLPTEVIMQIEDEGRGFDPAVVSIPGAALGLLGMRERVESIGGSLTIQSIPGKGTRVLVSAPQVGLVSTPATGGSAFEDLPSTADNIEKKHMP